jgi:hypothetical protein
VNLWGNVDASDSSDPGASLELDILLGNATSLVDYAGGPLCYSASDPSSADCGSAYSTSTPYNGDTQVLGDPSASLSSLSDISAPEPAAAWLLAAPSIWILRRRLRNPATR